MTESCESCRFFRIDIGVITGKGDCRRNAPVVLANCEGQTVYSRTVFGEWCGEWQEKKVPHNFSGKAISCLELPNRVLNALRFNRVFFISDLVQITEEGLAERKGFGKKNTARHKTSPSKN